MICIGFLFAFQMIYVFIVRDKNEKDFAKKYDNVDSDVLKIVDYAIENFESIKDKITPLLNTG